MHKSAMKCNETLSKWCKNKHGASKNIDTLETYHWSGPKKPPRSPVMYDGEISVVQPVIRLPRRANQRNWHDDVHSMTKQQMSRALKSHAVSEVTNTASCVTANEVHRGNQAMVAVAVHAAVNNKVQPTVSNEFEALAGNAVDSAETWSSHDVPIKKKFTEEVGAVQLQQNTPQNGRDQEEELICWSGPPKTPRSPIHCTEQVFVTEPVYRQPRGRVQTKHLQKTVSFSKPSASFATHLTEDTSRTAEREIQGENKSNYVNPEGPSSSSSYFEETDRTYSDCDRSANSGSMCDEG
jgi:hypothetical protein